MPRERKEVQIHPAHTLNFGISFLCFSLLLIISESKHEHQHDDPPVYQQLNCCSSSLGWTPDSVNNLPLNLTLQKLALVSLGGARPLKTSPPITTSSTTACGLTASQGSAEPRRRGPIMHRDALKLKAGRTHTHTHSHWALTQHQRLELLH